MVAPVSNRLVGVYAHEGAPELLINLFGNSCLRCAIVLLGDDGEAAHLARQTQCATVALAVYIQHAWVAHLPGERALGDADDLKRKLARHKIKHDHIAHFEVRLVGQHIGIYHDTVFIIGL